MEAIAAGWVSTVQTWVPVGVASSGGAEPFSFGDWSSSNWLALAATVTAGCAVYALFSSRSSIRGDNKDWSIWRGGMDEFKKNMDEFKENTTAKLGSIEESIRELVFQKRSVIKTTSPMTLSALGKRVWSQLDAANWLLKHAAEVSGKTKVMSEYEVQNWCFEHMATLNLDPPQQNRVRNAAYRNGVTEFQVRQIMAIKLRDALLSMCPVCGEDATPISPGGDWLGWSCTGGCGDFRVSGSAAAVLRGSDRDLDVARVRACLAEKRADGGDSPMIRVADLEGMTTAPDPAKIAG